MKEAQFLYKCRRCGKIDRSLCGPADRAFADLMDAVFNTHVRSDGIQVRLIDTHCCEDGGGGVSDLIGYEIVEKDD